MTLQPCKQCGEDRHVLHDGLCNRCWMDNTPLPQVEPPDFDEDDDYEMDGGDPYQRRNYP